jgi:flavodoxin
VYDTVSASKLTGQVAETITKALKEDGVDVDSFYVKDVDVATVKNYDCFIAGAPTMAFRPSRWIMEFFNDLADIGFSGKRAAAFDTQVQNVISGNATKGIEKKLKKLGFTLTPQELDLTCQLVKELGDKKGQVFYEDLVIIVEDQVRKPPQVISLDDYIITSGTWRKADSHASVSIRENGTILQAMASAVGPIHALYKALDTALKIETEVKDYNVRSITTGKTALGEVTVKIRYNGKDYIGRSASINILEASANAYVNAVNKALLKEMKQT